MGYVCDVVLISYYKSIMAMRNIHYVPNDASNVNTNLIIFPAKFLVSSSQLDMLTESAPIMKPYFTKISSY